jgi:RNA polymerase sigma-70 factor (ECF subfamily)
MAQSGTTTAEKALVTDADAPDVRLAQGGDGGAFERIVRRHQETIAAQMWRFTREPRLHEELVQNVFVEAWRSLRGFRGNAPFIHWLRKIAVRTGYAFWRDRDSRRDEVTLDDGIAATLAAPQAAEARHAAEAVHAVLGKLPPRDRLVLTLLHLEGRSVAESAQVLGWSPVMVKVQAWRARAKLKKLLERLDADGNAGGQD